MTVDDASNHGQLTADAAEVYEAFFVPALFAQWVEPVLDAARVAAGDAVLDVGCGTGVASRGAAARVGPSGHVTGLDRNPGMLAVAQRSGAPVEWRLGRAEAVPAPAATFDRVLCPFALMFFEDPAAATAEMVRVLRPGGTVAVATWSAVSESPGYAAMVELLRELVGPPAAEALLVPFRLGTPEALAATLRTAFPDVVVRRHEGWARFDSIDTWLHTDIRGWTLGGLIDDGTFDRLLAHARAALLPFTDGTGRVRFRAPALIATGRVPL